MKMGTAVPASRRPPLPAKSVSTSRRGGSNLQAFTASSALRSTSSRTPRSIQLSVTRPAASIRTSMMASCSPMMGANPDKSGSSRWTSRGGLSPDRNPFSRYTHFGPEPPGRVPREACPAGWCSPTTFTCWHAEASAANPANVQDQIRQWVETRILISVRLTISGPRSRAYPRPRRAAAHYRNSHNRTQFQQESGSPPGLDTREGNRGNLPPSR